MEEPKPLRARPVLLVIEQRAPDLTLGRQPELHVVDGAIGVRRQQQRQRLLGGATRAGRRHPFRKGDGVAHRSPKLPRLLVLVGVEADDQRAIAHDANAIP
jgi:hypothetical protein